MSDNKMDGFTEKHNALSDKVADHHLMLYGKDGNFGVSQKVAVMWRAHVWILCTLTGIVSSALTAAMYKWIK